jgi:hypothetical protein
VPSARREPKARQNTQAGLILKSTCLRTIQDRPL